MSLFSSFTYVRVFFFFAVCCCFLWSFFSRLTKQTLHTGSSHIGGYNHHNNEVRYITVGGWAKQRIIYYTSDTLLVSYCSSCINQLAANLFAANQFAANLFAANLFVSNQFLWPNHFAADLFAAGNIFFVGNRQSLRGKSVLATNRALLTVITIY